MIVPVIQGLLSKIDREIIVKVKLHGNSQLSFIGSPILVTGDFLFYFIFFSLPSFEPYS